MKQTLFILTFTAFCGYLLAQPVLQVLPSNLSLEVGFGLPSLCSATISNTGDEDLQYSISSPYIHPHLIAYFPFDGNATNYAPGGQNATVMGAAPTTDRFGRPNGAYYLDGQDDAIHLGQYQLGLDWSVSFYMQSFQYATWNRVFNAHHFNENDWPGEPDISITQYPGGGGDNYIVHNDYNTYFFPNLNIPDMEYVHLTLTVSATGIWKIYVNGSLFGTHTEPYDPGTFIRDVFLGTNANVTSFFNGIFDDVMLFDTELNSNEVNLIWNYVSLPLDDRSLLGFSSYEGIVAPESSVEVTITIPSTVLPIGHHDLAWTIQSNDPMHPELSQCIGVNILAPVPVIDATPVNLYFDSDNVFDEFTIGISNLGPGVLDYSLSLVDSTLASPAMYLENIQGFTQIGIMDNHRYYRSDFNASWESAKVQCEQLGGHLLTLSSHAEDVFAADGYIWLGLSDRDIDGNWRWVTGEPLTYTNWGVGEPSGNGENYGESNNHFWNDISDGNRQFVLEFDNLGSHPSVSFTPQQGRIVPGESNTISVSVNASSLTTGTYQYFVKVLSNSSTSAVFIPLTISANHILPQRVQNFSVVDELTDANQIFLSWSPNEVNDRVTDYKLYRRGKHESSWRLLATLEGGSLSYIDRSFTPMDTTWVWYQISAINDLGEGPRTEPVVGALKRYLAPTNLSMQIINSWHVGLTWNPVVETIAGTPGTPTCYVIYKSERPIPLSDFDFLAITFSASYTHQYAAYFQPVNRLFYVVTAYGGDVDRMNILANSRAGWKFGELDVLLQKTERNGKP